MLETLVIDAMTPADWPAVRAIHEDGIRTGHSTFDTSSPSWETWNEGHLNHCRLVARLGDRVVGWAALSPVSDTCAYSGVAEVSIYLSEGARGHGIGSKLLGALIIDSEREDIWTLQAGIFPDNRSSIALFESKGFRIVGRRERLGELNGVWRDVMLLERRSRVAGR
jgi:phosphinothricin acetyltransferase